MTSTDQKKKRYWDEISLVEDLRSFHPEAFDALNLGDRTALLTYYALDEDVADVYDYKTKLDAERPELASAATRALLAFKKSLGVQDS